MERLRQHPYITIDQWSIEPPATLEIIDTFEMISGIGLPGDVKDFYLAANGITCIWRIRQDLDTGILEKIKEEGEQAGYDYAKPLGALRILPVQDMLMDKYWKPPVQEDSAGNTAFSFGDQEYTRAAFAKKIKPFDLYHIENDAECMAFIIQSTPVESRFDVMMLDDYFADWQNSRTTDFDTYIRAMCSTHFTIPSRKRLFGKYRGDKEPVLTYDMLPQEDLTPAIFAA